jgi:hypothetical protein
VYFSSTGRSSSSTCRQLTQQKVQKSSRTKRPRRSRSRSGPSVFSQPRPRSSGARTRAVLPGGEGVTASLCCRPPTQWSLVAATRCRVSRGSTWPSLARPQVCGQHLEWGASTIAVERREALTGEKLLGTAQPVHHIHIGTFTQKAVTTMDTTQPTWATTGPLREVAVGGIAPVCRCGQDLDVCTGRHCTRCGVTLFQESSVIAA